MILLAHILYGRSLTSNISYSCDVQIDTLDYEKSVKSFKQRLKELGGFVEEEQYSDGVGVYGYYVEEFEKKTLHPFPTLFALTSIALFVL